MIFKTLIIWITISFCSTIISQEINDMNDIKAEGERLKTVIAAMRSREGIDQRWVSIAETHLQQGIMAAVRAVAQPESF